MFFYYRSRTKYWKWNTFHNGVRLWGKLFVLFQAFILILSWYNGVYWAVLPISVRTLSVSHFSVIPCHGEFVAQLVKVHNQWSACPWFKHRWRYYLLTGWVKIGSSPRGKMSFVRDVKQEMPCRGPVTCPWHDENFTVLSKRAGEHRTVEDVWPFSVNRPDMP